MRPRLGGQNGSINLFEPSTGSKVSYDYGVVQNSIIFLNYDSNVQNSYNISLRTPGGKYASEVLLDDLPVQFESLKSGDDLYVTFSSYPGKHKAVIELVQSYEMSDKSEVAIKLDTFEIRDGRSTSKRSCAKSGRTSA